MTQETWGKEERYMGKDDDLGDLRVGKTMTQETWGEEQR